MHWATRRFSSLPKAAAIGEISVPLRSILGGKMTTAARGHLLGQVIQVLGRFEQLVGVVRPQLRALQNCAGRFAQVTCLEP